MFEGLFSFFQTSVAWESRVIRVSLIPVTSYARRAEQQIIDESVFVLHRLTSWDPSDRSGLIFHSLIYVVVCYVSHAVIQREERNLRVLH